MNDNAKLILNRNLHIPQTRLQIQLGTVSFLMNYHLAQKQPFSWTMNNRKNYLLQNAHFRNLSTIILMDNRPIKGNQSGKYNMEFVDPTNDICAYYGGMNQLALLVQNYLQTVTYHTYKPVKGGESKVYNQNVKKEHYLDHCSVCLGQFTQGENVKVLPCKHCFHKDCVAPWFSSNSHCPNCRYELKF